MSLWTYLQYRFARPKRNRTPQDEWIASREFLHSREWKRARYEALRANNGRCELCGRGKHDGVTLNVDHVKPRSIFPQLALNVYNLQVLDSDCNAGKSYVYRDDWRHPSHPHRTWRNLFR